MVTKRVHNIPEDSPDQFKEQNDDSHAAAEEPVGFFIGGRKPRPLIVASKSVAYAARLMNGDEEDDDKGIAKMKQSASLDSVAH